MRMFLYFLAVVMVIALAFWSYGENYETREARNELRKLHHDIREAQKRLDVLHSEWAYLNRPDRLQDLADAHFDSLGLLAIEPAQFGGLDKIPLAAEPDAGNTSSNGASPTGGTP